MAIFFLESSPSPSVAFFFSSSLYPRDTNSRTTAAMERTSVTNVTNALRRLNVRFLIFKVPLSQVSATLCLAFSLTACCEPENDEARLLINLIKNSVVFHALSPFYAKRADEEAEKDLGQTKIVDVGSKTGLVGRSKTCRIN